MPYVITEGCIDILDRQCMSQCPVDAIAPGERMAYIHPVDCIDCGACMPACPQNAIFLVGRVPEESEDFVAINAEFFDINPSPDLDGPNPDHPALANYHN